MSLDDTIPKARIPVASKGQYRIERFCITKKDEQDSRWRSLLSHSRNYCPAGRYTRLMRGNTLVASDSYSERREQLEPVHRAAGHILVNGLGLGLTVQACLLKPEVLSITIIEIDQDVINLIGPYYSKKHNGRLKIVHADALTWKPPRGQRYHVVWHDIWDAIDADNLPSMCKLHRKYGRRCNWQGSWMRRECEKLRDTDYRPNRLLRFL